MAVSILLLQKKTPELLAPAFLYKKKLKRNAGAISSGVFYIKKSKKTPELLAPAFFI